MPEHFISVRRGLAARPALRLAVLLAAGTATARALEVPGAVWFALCVATAAGAVLLLHITSHGSSSSPRLLFFADILLHASVFLVSSSLFAVADTSGRAERLSPVRPDYPVVAYGWIVTPTNPTRSGFSFVLQSDSIRSADWLDTEQRGVTVYMSSRYGGPAAEPGSRVMVEGTLEKFPAPRNPGENDYGATLGLQGISAVMRGSSIIPDTSGTFISFRALVGSIQDHLYRWIDELHPGEHGSFVKGIILGYRADLPEELKDAFMVTGTVHILAVSGSNVALIGLIVMVCSGFLRIGRTIRMSLTIGGMLLYMLVTGGGPSITRATIMGIIVVLVAFLPRRGDVMQSLGVSACVLLFVDPRTLYDAGFLLSFGSVVWIVTGSPVMQRAIASLPEEFRDSLVIRSALQLCGVSFLAQLGTIPISAYYFGQISLISVLANLAVVPLSAVVLLLGVAELALYPLIPWLAVPYAEANGLIIDVLLGIVRLAAEIPHASIGVRLDSILEAILLYSIFVCVVWYANARVRNTSMLALLVCLNLLIWTSAVKPAGHHLEWIAADVGQGDAHFIRTSTGQIVLIDAAPHEGAAERMLLPLLERSDVDQIDWLILTHPHRDHTAGLGVLLDRLPVRTLVLSDSVWIGGDEAEAIATGNVRILRARAGMSIPLDDNVRMYVLHPDVVLPSGGWNNNSIVIQVMYGDTKLLLTGDLEEEGEELLVRTYGSFLTSGLLKAGHHGSKTSTTPALLNAVRPEVAVLSVGWRNRFGHPSPETVSELERRDIRIVRTSEQGASWWRSDGTRWSEVLWR